MDYNATAPLLPCAREAMMFAMSGQANPSSVHYEGQKARRIINSARDKIATIGGVKPDHVTFTSGATEAASHLLTPNYRLGRSLLTISKLYISTLEHPCVLSGGRFQRENIEYIGANQDGHINLAELREKLSAHDVSAGLPMVVLQGANNETGVLQPLSEAFEIAKKYKAITVVDAAQTLGKIPFSLSDVDADFAFVSGHKIGGPKGVGAIISCGDVLMPEPLICGGGHEKGHRAGTENLIGIAGFGASCDAALKTLSEYKRLGEIRDRLEKKMIEFAPDIVIYGKNAERLANTSCFTLPGISSETLQIAFDVEGIALSSGSACSSGKVGKSHVLAAMGADAQMGALRVSLGLDSHDEDQINFMAAFETINARRLELNINGNAAA